MTDFQQLMGALDAALTGHSFERVAQQLHHYTSDVKAWLFGTDQGVWYLSDGGYSRVAFNFETGRLFLTHNSRQQVVDKWADAAPQIAQAERYIRQEVEQAEGKADYWEPLTESNQSDIVVGVVTANKNIRSQLGGTHKQIGQNGACWRYQPINRTVYWHGDDSEHDQEDEMLVRNYLLNDYGEIVKANVTLEEIPEIYTMNHNRAHGLWTSENMNSETLVNKLLEQDHDAHVKSWERVQKWDKAHDSYKDLHQKHLKARDVFDQLGSSIGYERALARAGLTREEVSSPVYGADVKTSSDLPFTRPSKICRVNCVSANQPMDAESCSGCGGELVNAEAPMPLRVLNQKYARYIVGVLTNDGRKVYFKDMIPPKGKFEA